MITLVANAGAFISSQIEVILRLRTTQPIVTRLTLQARKPASDYCQPQITNTWFPIAPGVTTPVSAPAPITNEVSAPPNSVAVPVNFNIENPDLCFLFQDLLPVNQSPVYPIEQDAEFLTQPYNEIVRSIALVRSFVSVQSLNYPLNLETRNPVLSVAPTLQLIGTQLIADPASFVITGRSALFSYARTLRPNSGSFILGRPAPLFIRDYRTKALAGSVSLAGNANLIRSTIFTATEAAVNLSGQDAVLLKFNVNEFYIPAINIATAFSLLQLDTRAELSVSPGNFNVSASIPLVPAPGPVLQSVGSANAGTGGVFLSWPSGHQSGDIGLAVIECSGDDSTITSISPSGWQAVPATPAVDVATSAGSKLQAWWKRATSSDESGITIPDTGDHQVARIFAFRGVVSTGVPWNSFAIGAKTTESSTATVPSIKTFGYNSLVIMLISRPDDSNSVAHFFGPVNANLKFLTEQTETGTTQGNGGGYTMVTGLKEYPGETGETTVTKAVSTTDAYMVLELLANPPTRVDLYTPITEFLFIAKDPTITVG